jgi:hypothetical protein
MAYTPSSPITGAAQAGFTSPTYTLVADNAPSINAKQWYVSALGGTQVGVAVHSISVPFTLAVFKPAVMATLGTPNPSTGIIYNVKRNVYKFNVRKGVTVLAGQPPQIMLINCSMEVPAGADVSDPANVKAAISALIGALNNQASGIGDTAQNGSI